MMKLASVKRRRGTAARLAVAAGIAALVPAGSASAYYMGPAYLEIPGVTGGTGNPAEFGNWVRVEANYWTERPKLREIRGITGKYSGLKFTGPLAPRSGPNMLAVSVAKSSRALPALMERCRKGERLPRVTFAESSEMARHPQERGPPPADVPEHYRYALKGVRLTCPVVAEAPEQAFGLHFDEIEWLNFKPMDAPREVSAQPAKLPPASLSGASKTFVITWFAPVSDSSADQCPRMNTKPTQEEYYALMPPERAAKQRAFLADKGGANTTYLPFRGPDEMNVTMLPGIVPDPGHVEPQTSVVRGFDLDGDDGSGGPPAHTRKHKNYMSPDGRKGIDNQLFTIQGCVEGWRRNGFLPMIGNELRRAGGLSILVDISGIDDPRNDDEVAVTIVYSATAMKKSGFSRDILPDFTYRINDDPEFTQHFARFRGRIADGVIVTEPLKRIHMHEGPSSTWTLLDARMRLEILPDGKLSALLGGYRDWRQYIAMAFFRSSDYENTIGFKAPAMYNAVRRAADGLRDPVSGEFTGISAAYELEGIPAFIPPSQRRQLALEGMLRPPKRGDIEEGRPPHSLARSADGRSVAK